MYAVYCIATKHAESTSDKIPQQYVFVQDLWHNSFELKKTSILKRCIKKVDFIHKMAINVVRLFSQTRLQSKFKKL